MEETKTANVFQGTPDARQEGDIKPTRFRPRYRALSEGEKALHDAIKTKATELEELFNQVKDQREKINKEAFKIMRKEYETNNK